MGRLRFTHGAADSTWITAGNWDTAAAPIDADDVYHSDGSYSINGADHSSIELASMQIGEGWLGTLASTGTKLQIDATVLRFQANGGKAYLNGIFPSIYVSSRAGVSEMLEVTGTITSLYVVNCSGSMTVTAGADLVNLYIINSPNVQVTLGASITNLALIRANSGTIISGSAFVTARLDGTAYMTHSLGTITTLDMRGRSRVLHNASGTITTLETYDDAIFDGRANINKQITVTNASQWGNSQINTDAGMDAYIFTNGILDYTGKNFEVGRKINRA